MRCIETFSGVGDTVIWPVLAERIIGAILMYFI